MNTKKYGIALALAAGLVLVGLSSCQVSSVCVGEVKTDTPTVKVKTIHNNFFLGGLVGRQKIVAPEYTMGLTDYKVKNYHSIVDVILQNITAGIYTPTTTEIYLPANYRQPQKADTQK